MDSRESNTGQPHTRQTRWTEALQVVWGPQAGCGWSFSRCRECRGSSGLCCCAVVRVFASLLLPLLLLLRKWKHYGVESPSSESSIAEGWLPGFDYMDGWVRTCAQRTHALHTERPHVRNFAQEQEGQSELSRASICVVCFCILILFCSCFSSCSVSLADL